MNGSRIAIIGNGFDLAHGLKTGYGDFIKAQDEAAFSEYRTLSERYCSDVKDWTSFEERINELTFGCYQTAMDEPDRYEAAVEDIARINRMFSDLRSRLSSYLTAVTAEERPEVLSIRQALQGDVPAINFNYTDTAERYTKNVFYVHGSLKEQEIVLGYDFREEPCLMFPELMHWSKILCRERLAFSRFLFHRSLAPGEPVYDECMEDVCLMQNLKNSGRGFEDEDWGKLRHAGLLRAFCTGAPHSYEDRFDLIDLSEVTELVILGHSLSADAHYLTELLNKCPRLRQVTLFSRGGASTASTDKKKAFFRPYCDHVVLQSY